MDGHLAKPDYLAVSPGRYRRQHVAPVGQSSLALVVGPSMQRAGQIPNSRSGVERCLFPHLMTLAEMGSVSSRPLQLSNRQVPEWIDISVVRVTDTTIDTHARLTTLALRLARRPIVGGLAGVC